MVANILPADIPTPWPWGSKGQNSTFSEHGHVAYQIKENHKCSNKVANILPSDAPPRPWGWGQKVRIRLFQNMVMLHIKFNGITNAVDIKYFARIRTPPWTLGWGQNSSFTEHGHVAYQIKGNHECSNMVANILPEHPHTPPPPPHTHTSTRGFGSKGQKSTISEYGHVAYQFKGNGKKSKCGHVSYQIKGKEV